MDKTYHTQKNSKCKEKIKNNTNFLQKSYIIFIVTFVMRSIFSNYKKILNNKFPFLKWGLVYFFQLFFGTVLLSLPLWGMDYALNWMGLYIEPHFHKDSFFLAILLSFLLLQVKNNSFFFLFFRCYCSSFTLVFSIIYFLADILRDMILHCFSMNFMIPLWHFLMILVIIGNCLQS